MVPVKEARAGRQGGMTVKFPLDALMAKGFRLRTGQTRG